MGFGAMTVGKRLYVGFGLILAILVAMTVVGITKVQAINAARLANCQAVEAANRALLHGLVDLLVAFRKA